jgi:hypothetical protein
MQSRFAAGFEPNIPKNFLSEQIELHLVEAVPSK